MNIEPTEEELMQFQKQLMETPLTENMEVQPAPGTARIKREEIAAWLGEEVRKNLDETHIEYGKSMWDWAKK